MKKITLPLLFVFYIGFSQSLVPFYPTDQASGSDFGSKVDVFDNEILVSSSTELLSNPASIGKVYLFNKVDNELEQTNSFYPNDALSSDEFGASLSIRDGFIAIGSPFHDANLENSGAVYLYHKVGGSYQLMQKITAADTRENDNFGSFVKIYNNQLFISAAGDEPDLQDINTNNGSVYVYSLIGNVWTFSEKITHDNSLHFGQKVEAENNTIVIAWDYPNGPEASQYILYTYAWDNSHWAYENSHYYLYTQQGNNDFSLSNNELFVLITDPNSPNKIIFYSKVGNEWVGISEYDMGPDNILTKIKVNNNTMFLGSTQYTLQTERNFPVRIFKRNGNYWNQQLTIHGTGPTGLDDYFGSAIASQGNSVIIGAPKEGPLLLSGKAYYLDMATLNADVFEKKSSQVYPNPTQNVVHIETDNSSAINSVNVYTVTGNLIYSNNLNTTEVSLENVAQGIYFMKVKFENNTEETFKIIRN